MRRKGRDRGFGGHPLEPRQHGLDPVLETSFARFGHMQVRQRTGRQSEATELEVNRAVLQRARRRAGASSPWRAGRAITWSPSRHDQEDVTADDPLRAALQEQRQAERIFRWVMGSLAAISLLVGGVGIMNIMLANMAERRQEVGLRRALGATSEPTSCKPLRLREHRALL